MIKKGDIVDIKEEYQDEGDHRCVWMAMCDEYDGRLIISPVNLDMPIKPTYLVKIEWIHKKMNMRRFIKPLGTNQ